jgi:hypothetical protein
MSVSESDRAVPYDFFLCQKCHRLITAVEMAESMGVNPVRKSACPCGGGKIAPANMRWYHWFLPRVWTFAVARVRGLA